VNAFILSPRDLEVMVAAVSGVLPTGRIVKSVDHGQNWTPTLTHSFGEYDTPLEADPDHPDTMYFAGSADRLYRSTDGGDTWSAWSDVTFRGGSDLVVIPDASNIIVVGDGVVGNGSADYYRSADGGATFTLVASRPAGSSRVPAMGSSRLRNAVAFATNWGLGGVQRSPDFGASWPDVNKTDSAFGLGIAADDPNCVLFGVYSGGASYLSLDGGSSFTTTPLASTNYSFYARDRETILAAQSDGIYKMDFTYAYTPLTGVDPTSRPSGGVTLWPNRPNPFTGRTEIRYALPAPSRVRLEVFDLAGRRVATLVDARQDAGAHSVSFDPRRARDAQPGGLRPGVYLYRLRAEGGVATRRMLLVE
jgi:hypothetical protein